MTTKDFNGKVNSLTDTMNYKADPALKLHAVMSDFVRSIDTLGHAPKQSMDLGLNK